MTIQDSLMGKIIPYVDGVEQPLSPQDIPVPDQSSGRVAGLIYPKSYDPVPVYLQSPPNAAQGGYKHLMRNWYRNIVIAGGDTYLLQLDESDGDWLTVNNYSVSCDSVFTPDITIFNYGDGSPFVPWIANLSKSFFQFRRTTNMYQLGNPNTDPDQCILWMVFCTDYESRPTSFFA